jgi:hypothetical protein
MKNSKIAFFLLIYFLFIPVLHADIYSWTDDKGVKHFTNRFSASAGGTLTKTEEILFDEANDKELQRKNEWWWIENVARQIAEKEAAIEKREEETEKKLAAAQQKTEEALRVAEKMLEMAEKRASEANTGVTCRFRYVVPRPQCKISPYYKTRGIGFSPKRQHVNHRIGKQWHTDRLPLNLKKPWLRAHRDKFLRTQSPQRYPIGNRFGLSVR